MNVEAEIEPAPTQRELQHQAIAELGQIALQEGRFDELCESAVEAAARCLNVRFSKLLELNPEGQALTIRAGLGWKPGLVGRAAVPADIGSQAGYTLLTSDTVVVRDFGFETRFEAPSLLREHGIRCGASLIVGPVGEPWGVLGVHESEPGRCNFDRYDVDFLQSIANILWLHIRNERSRKTVERDQDALRAFANAMPLLFFILDRAGRYEFMNEAYRDIGVDPVASIGRHSSDVIGPDAFARFEPNLQRALAGEVARFENVLTTETGEPRSVLVTCVPRTSRSGEIDGFYGAVIDITERKQREESLALLSAELDHRVKNVFALVTTLARLASRSASDVDAYCAAFEGRLQSLAAAHELIAESRWTGMSLRSLVRTELAPFKSEEERRWSVSGPYVRLPVFVVQPLALALHELTTNAVKHGALSVPEGTLSVRWSLTPDGDLSFVWGEDGLAGITPPERTGFGTRVLAQVLETQLEAQIDLDYRETGLVARILVPRSVIEGVEDGKSQA